MKYETPSTEPLFRLCSVSSSTPIQVPRANLVHPRKRTVALTREFGMTWPLFRTRTRAPGTSQSGLEGSSMSSSCEIGDSVRFSLAESTEDMELLSGVPQDVRASLELFECSKLSKLWLWLALE